jgi:hypothetical protein
MNPATEDTPAVVFAKDAVRRDNLAAILDNPVFREAVDLAKDMMAPKAGTQADAVPAIAAARFHQVAGAKDLLDNLRMLTREPKKAPVARSPRLARSIDDLPKES